MKCLRSGYCCTHLEVIIVNDPELGIVEGNCIPKHSGVKCQHLKGTGPGQYKCSVYNYPWYKETPCAEHTQIVDENSPCRTGEYMLKQIM